MQQDKGITDCLEGEIRDLHEHLQDLLSRRLKLRFRMVGELEKSQETDGRQIGPRLAMPQFMSKSEEPCTKEQDGGEHD